MATDLHDIEQVPRTYFDGLYEGDTGRLAAIFHPEAHLFSVTDGKLDDLPRAAWFDLIKSRPSVASREPRSAETGLGGSDRSFRPEHGLRQGAVPDPASVFHGLSDVGETR
jgi:hypothetical protein